MQMKFLRSSYKVVPENFVKPVLNPIGNPIGNTIGNAVHRLLFQFAIIDVSYYIC